MVNHWYHWTFLGIASLALLAGCGESSRRRPIEGTVTLDGAPLAEGHISFRPEPGSRGPTAGAQVVDGKYLIPAKGGTFAGKFRIEITASRRSGRKVPDRFSGEPIDEIVQYLPARYNSQSELIAEVKEEGLSELDFALQSE